MKASTKLTVIPQEDNEVIITPQTIDKLSMEDLTGRRDLKPPTGLIPPHFENALVSNEPERNLLKRLLSLKKK